MAIPLPIGSKRPPNLRIAVITDLHHGLAPDAQQRLAAFVASVSKRDDLAFVIQMGDFCHADGSSTEFLQLWKGIQLPKLHVLGNHDMDRVDKATAMAGWGMKDRFYSHTQGGYRFVVLDLNHFKKDGKLVSYANGNYFTDNATHNWADPEQLAWLENVLSAGSQPTVLISHQPMGLTYPGKPMPPEQQEVLDVVFRCAERNPKGAVVACLSGHLHVDWLERYRSIPCMCVNSASYFWSSGMVPYTNPLFAVFEIDPSGRLNVQGQVGEFRKAPPSDSDWVPGRSASIASRSIALPSA